MTSTQIWSMPFRLLAACTSSTLHKRALCISRGLGLDLSEAAILPPKDFWILVTVSASVPPSVIVRRKMLRA